MKNKRFKNARNKIKNFFIKIKNKDTSFFIIALCVLLLSTALIWRYTISHNDNNLAKNESEEGDINANVDPYKEYVDEVIDEYANQNKDKKDESKLDLKSMNAPLRGEIIKNFSMDELVYYEAIGEWRVHKGVDIKPKDSLIIESAYSGTVEKVNTSDISGTEIIIDHGNGIKTVYNNLSSSKVKVGDSVTKGQTIGNVGKVNSIESADGPHLHFELIVDGKNVNPVDYIPEE